MSRRLQSGILAVLVQVAVGGIAVAARAAAPAPSPPFVNQGPELGPAADPGQASGYIAPPKPSVAPAVAASANPFGDDVQAVSSADLKKERGGFRAGGVTFNIGASVETTVNGALALVSTLNLTPSGHVTQSTWVNPSLPNATIIKSSDKGAISKATGLDLSGLDGSSGLVIKPTNGTGETVALTNVTPTMLQNVLINTASNQVITQNTNITFTLPGFAQTTQLQNIQASLFMQLSSALDMARLGGR
ncbi:MAG: hypothetical protein ACREEW_01630 [Caulobacteraceae bacterium]